MRSHSESRGSVGFRVKEWKGLSCRFGAASCVLLERTPDIPLECFTQGRASDVSTCGAYAVRLSEVSCRSALISSVVTFIEN